MPNVVSYGVVRLLVSATLVILNHRLCFGIEVNYDAFQVTPELSSHRHNYSQQTFQNDGSSRQLHFPSILGGVHSKIPTELLDKVQACIDCNEVYGKDCKLPLTHDLENSPEDACCLSLCLRKYPDTARFDPDWDTEQFDESKYYTVLGRKDFMGKRNVSVCLCLEDLDGLQTEQIELPENPPTGESGTLEEYVEERFKLPEPQCQNKCKSLDKFGTVWEECPGISRDLPCPQNGWGTTRWDCLSSGVFDGREPNFGNCRSQWLSEMQDDFAKMTPRHHLTTFENANVMLDKTMVQLKLTNTNDPTGGARISPSYFDHEFDTIVNMVGKVCQTNESNVGKLEALTMKAVDVYGSVMLQAEPAGQIVKTSWSRRESRRKATNLLSTMEGSVLALSRTSLMSTRMLPMTNAGEDYEKIFSQTKAFRVSTGTVEKSRKNKKSKRKFLGWNAKDGSNDKDPISSLTLPDGWDAQIQGDNVLYVGIKIRDPEVKKMFPESMKSDSDDDNPVGGPKALINGPILSLSISNPEAEMLPINFKGQGARIVFKHDTPASVGHSDTRIRRKLYAGEQPKAASGSSVCVYWDTANLVWSQSGCRLIETTAESTTCECQHLTAFAVLMDMHNYVGKDIGLITLTFILCIFSSIFLLISIIIFITLRTARSPRTGITIQLCACLLIGNILVISVMDRNNFNMSSSVCAISAMITHYVFLCAFAWMAIEGFVVYKMLVDVFDSGTDNKRLLNGIAYGAPFLFVLVFAIIHAGSQQNVYGGEMYCWLVGNYLWSFIGPVFIIVTGNICVMAIALYKVYQLNNSTMQVKKKAKSFRTWIFGSLSLTFLLGLTWLFGALLLIPNSNVANVSAYIFSIFNASQGFFIFIFHCWMNENVRSVLRRKFSQGLSTQSQSQSRSSKPSAEVKMSVTPGTASTSVSVALPPQSQSAEPTEEERFQISRDKERTKSESSQTSQNSRTPAFFRFSSANQNGKDDNAFM